MTIDTKRPVSVKLAPCEERRRRWLEIEQNLCDAALRMGKEPHLGEGWYKRIVKPELTLLADKIDRLAEELDCYRNGYKGGCYACETVGEKNVELRAEVERLREQLAMVRGLKCHRCEGRGRHYHDGICELCMGSGKRVPEREDDE